MRSRSTGWATMALGAVAGWVLSAGTAFALPPAGGAAVEDEELGPEAGTKRPAGPDERSGHVLLHGRFGLAQPFGSIAAALPASSIVSGGAAFGANIGLGISRVTVLEASGSYAMLPGSSRCDECSGTSFDVGLGLVYHIAQGLALDPWISYGIGYRRATFIGSTRTTVGLRTFPDTAFQGVDIARIAIGGDFYPVPALGFGPFLELDVGTYVSRPQGGFGQTTYGFLQLGVRVALDPVPRGRTAPAVAGSSLRAVAGRPR